MYPLLAFLISFLFLKVIRFQSRKTLIQKYHNTITDSTANGSNNNLLTIVIFILVIFFAVGSILNTMDIDGQLDTEPAADGIPAFYFPLMTLHTLIGSTCFLWNMEFKQFLYRKVAAKDYNFFNRIRRPAVSTPATHCPRKDERYIAFQNNGRYRTNSKSTDPLMQRSDNFQRFSKPRTSRHTILEINIPSSVLFVKEAGH